MATMDVVIHYPQLSALREQIAQSACAFYETNLRDILDKIVTQPGPSSQFVMDLYLD